MIGFARGFKVRSDGYVWGTKSKMWHRGTPNKGGYYLVGKGIPDRCGVRCEGVHVLVAEAFLPRYKPEFNEVDHIHKKTDNSVFNLRFVTHSLNMLNRQCLYQNYSKRFKKYEARVRGTKLGYYQTADECATVCNSYKEIIFFVDYLNGLNEEQTRDAKERRSCYISANYASFARAIKFIDTRTRGRGFLREELSRLYDCLPTTAWAKPKNERYPSVF